MAISFVESIGLHMEGFNDQQIAQVEAIIPDVQQLATALKAQMPRIAKIAPDVQALLAAVEAELPRINKILPVVQMALAVVEQHQKESGS